ncbi:MAG: glycoside hydrolase 5 family protein [Pyrinomonadaceae bacterium]
MSKRLFVAASALLAVAAIVFAFSSWRGGTGSARRGFVRANGVRFVTDGKPFRFVGANVDVMFQQQTRAAMPEMMRVSASSGMKVVRIWASGEGGLEDVQPANNWRRDRWFRRTPTEWNEAEFVFLDRTIAEAARHGLRVQICLANWWRDTGGVTQYLRWAGINGADDDKYPFGINDEKAMLFYTNETTRRLYREHVEKIVGRRNTVTGVMYRDDPNIFGYELMNEARCLTGRWDERRAWITEMSAYVKSLDPDHVVAPGVWGYRTAAERREWLKDHALANIDYVDVHNYPRDDEDSFVDSPKALGEFIANRVSAAAMLQKPLVFGEFGVPHDGFNGASLLEWYRAFFEYTARDGASGAMFWILTPEPTRGYGVTYTTNRDAALLAEIRGASHLFSSLMNATPPPTLLEAGQHLVPRQFAFVRNETDESVRPQIVYEQDGRVLYRFAPETVVRGRFEKLGGGPGYIWGGGVGYFEFIVPGRETRRRVGEIVVRAHIQPVLPTDAKPDWVRTRVTLFVNGTKIDSRLVTWEDPKAPLIQEWKIDSLGPRLRAARALPFTVRFEVTPEADWLYGVNISNWPEGYDSKGAVPVEVELR